MNNIVIIIGIIASLAGIVIALFASIYLFRQVYATEKQEDKIIIFRYTSDYNEALVSKEFVIPKQRHHKKSEVNHFAKRGFETVYEYKRDNCLA